MTGTTTVLRIGTRSSALALWQANHVAELLRSNDPSIETELVSMDTFADQRLDLPIGADAHDPATTQGHGGTVRHHDFRISRVHRRTISMPRP